MLVSVPQHLPCSPEWLKSRYMINSVGTPHFTQRLTSDLRSVCPDIASTSNSANRWHAHAWSTSLVHAGQNLSAVRALELGCWCHCRVPLQGAAVGVAAGCCLAVCWVLVLMQGSDCCWPLGVALVQSTQSSGFVPAVMMAARLTIDGVSWNNRLQACALHAVMM